MDRWRPSTRRFSALVTAISSPAGATPSAAAAIIRREQEEKARKQKLDPLQGGLGALRENPEAFFTLGQQAECLAFFKVRLAGLLPSCLPG